MGTGSFKNGAAIRKVLVERGLTDAGLDAMPRLVDQHRASSDPPEGTRGIEVDAGAVVETQQAQREGSGDCGMLDGDCRSGWWGKSC